MRFGVGLHRLVARSSNTVGSEFLPSTAIPKMDASRVGAFLFYGVKYTLSLRGGPVPARVQCKSEPSVRVLLAPWSCALCLVVACYACHALHCALCSPSAFKPGDALPARTSCVLRLLRDFAHRSRHLFAPKGCHGRHPRAMTQRPNRCRPHQTRHRIIRGTSSCREEERAPLPHPTPPTHPHTSTHTPPTLTPL